MALTNDQCAWVNRSSSNVPVYGTLGSYNGYYSPGGNTIGNIYPNEFYTTRKNSIANRPWFEIRFRNSSGNMATGYITTLPQGYTYPEAA